MSETETAMRPVWRWYFHSLGELRAALEEYTEFHDDARIQRYGEDGGSSEGSDGKRMRIWRQNAEIDRRMAVMEVQAPWIWRLLDLYFRHGLCAERDGWVIAARRCGLEANPDSRWAKDAFDHQVAWCVERLWHVR